MIAAHVSGINACDYCYGAHTSIASAFGIDKNLFDEMQNDLDNSKFQRNSNLCSPTLQLTTHPSR